MVDDRTVEYQGERYSLSGLATKLTGGKWGVAGSRYFKYNGIWLNELRARKEGRQISPRLDDVWIIHCNPCYYDVVSAFEHLDVIEWNQLKPIEKYPADRYPLKDLLANGLTNVRGRSKAAMQLMKYLGQ